MPDASGATAAPGYAVSTVTRNADRIDRKMAGQVLLQHLLSQGRLLLSLVKDYATGKYRDIPFWVIGSSAVCLLYILSPIDLIPDVIPVIGYLDDAAVLGLTLKLVNTELQRYKAWKEGSLVKV
jgi:uncharacterized membrane protein YkvA (DUF1232 family)